MIKRDKKHTLNLYFPFMRHFHETRSKETIKYGTYTSKSLHIAQVPSDIQHFILPECLMSYLLISNLSSQETKIAFRQYEMLYVRRYTFIS